MSESKTRTVGAVLEIVESKTPGSDGDVVVPTEVRINGVSLYTSADHPIIVHEVKLDEPSLVYATLTLICRRVSIGFESEV